MRCVAPLVAVVLISGILLAQEKKPQAAPEQKNPTYVSPSARLAAAKTVFVKNNGGSEIPFNVISGGLEGWGRLLLVDSPGQADIIIEVTSPDDDHTSQNTSKTKVGVLLVITGAWSTGWFGGGGLTMTFSTHSE